MYEYLPVATPIRLEGSRTSQLCTGDLGYAYQNIELSNSRESPLGAAEWVARISQLPAEYHPNLYFCHCPQIALEGREEDMHETSVRPNGGSRRPAAVVGAERLIFAVRTVVSPV